ncbi:uncharacterized protein LOC119070715 [Bradysia coprophila]|uniref:uncharacterized protein LOC119070715 n=1 Tax=Bradysia coprophila TaxID=38358 RepID=UPI00187DC013|nr:uncharacterized protein LOC119070715 [Bradysia coprophila]
MSTLRSNCAVCGKSEDLIRCEEGCKYMLYCGQPHRLADVANHAVACDAVKRSKAKLDTEDRLLRNPMLAHNLFEVAKGNFWRIDDTRNYMKALYSHMDYLMKIKTYGAVKAAFGYAVNAFELCRTDCLMVRLVVPAIYVRLGKDQECYDFIKYSAVVGGDFNWPNTSIRDADVFEPIDVFDGETRTLEFALAAFLIKMKLLTDVRTLQNSLFLYTYLPFPSELVDRIRKLAVGEIVAERTAIFNSQNQNPLIQTLVLQIKQLYQVVKKANPYFWSGFLDPAEFLAARPPTYYDGTIEHAQTAVQVYYEAFVETPGSINMAREIAEKDG